MGFQDHRPQPKRAVKVSPNGPPRFSLPIQKATSDYLETPGKSRRSNDPREHFIAALRGAFVSDDTGHWPVVKLVAMARLTVPERAALAFSALRALPRDVREMTSLVAPEGVGAWGEPE